MKNGSILILSNSREAGLSIESRLKLLRKCDNIQQAEYIEAISILNNSCPSLIIVYSSNADSINIIKEIRSLKQLDKVPVVLAMEYFSEDKLLYAFDNGIDEFFFMNDSDAVILMRILLGLQKSILYNQIDTANDILALAGIIDRQSKLYTKEQTPMVFRRLFSKITKNGADASVFMCIKPMPLQNQKTGMSAVLYAAARAARDIPRGSDAAAIGKDGAFYLLLYGAGAEGAKSAASRIKHALIPHGRIFAAAAEINSSFEEMEKLLLQSVHNQMKNGIEFSFLNNLNINPEAKAAAEIQEQKQEGIPKNLFKAYVKTVLPVLKQTQKSASKRFPKSKSAYDISEKESWFKIKQDRTQSILTLGFDADLKLTAEMVHSTGARKPLEKRFSIDLADFSKSALIAMLSELLDEFESRINAAANKKQ